MNRGSVPLPFHKCSARGVRPCSKPRGGERPSLSLARCSRSALPTRGASSRSARATAPGDKFKSAIFVVTLVVAGFAACAKGETGGPRGRRGGDGGDGGSSTSFLVGSGAGGS